MLSAHSFGGLIRRQVHQVDRAATLVSKQWNSTTTSSASSSTGLLRLNRLPPTGTMTKIVCTIGPATDDAIQISNLVTHGMHVARLNFSHAGTDYTYPTTCMTLVRNAFGKHQSLMAGAVTPSIINTSSSSGDVAVAELPPNVRAILVDTKGPEIRTGPLQSNKDIIDIEVGDTVELTILDVSSDAVWPAGSHRVQVDYKSIAKSMKVGGHVLLDDGLIALEVTEVDPNLQYITCVALNSGPLKKNKGVNLPGVELDLPALTDKDKADLKWACDVGADFVAASFIRTAANVRSVIAFLDRCISQMKPNADGKLPLRPLVISKIESKEGVDNFFDILTESDGIMVARGDLGVEVSQSTFLFLYLCGCGCDGFL